MARQNHDNVRHRPERGAGRRNASALSSAKEGRAKGRGGTLQQPPTNFRPRHEGRAHCLRKGRRSPSCQIGGWLGGRGVWAGRHPRSHASEDGATCACARTRTGVGLFADSRTAPTPQNSPETRRETRGQGAENSRGAKESGTGQRNGGGACATTAIAAHVHAPNPGRTQTATPPGWGEFGECVHWRRGKHMAR
jgi:hypothetical protein